MKKNITMSMLHSKILMTMIIGIGLGEKGIMSIHGYNPW